MFITFRVSIFSVKHLIPTYIHSPNDISIKDSERAWKDQKVFWSHIVWPPRHLQCKVSKGDQYILIKYLALNFFPPQYKRIKAAMMSTNKAVSQIPASSPCRILSHKNRACISLRVKLIKWFEAIFNGIIAL